MKHRRTFTFCLLTLLALLRPALAQERLTVATAGEFPPFNYVDASGQLTGFDVDFARALCETLKAKCTLVRIPWAQLRNGAALADRKCDIVVASLAKTPEREKAMDFSNPYYRSRGAFVGKKDLAKTSLPEGLYGKRLATVEGIVQADYLQAQFDGKASLTFAKTMDELWSLLTSNEVDAVLFDSLAIYGFLTEPAGKPFDFVGEFIPGEDVSSTAHITVRKDNHALRDRVNEAIIEMKLNGSYDRINRKYFPFSVY